jgi:hypothetical protein
MMNDKNSLGITDPASDAEWQVWYQDLFDRERPRQVEISGRGLVIGLAELWARHLFETVQVDGQQGFSQFNLWWQEAEKSIAITGAREGMVRLRQWVFGNKRTVSQGYLGDGDQGLLMAVAVVHSYLVMSGQSSQPILTTAQNCEHLEDFQENLLILKEDLG